MRDYGARDPVSNPVYVSSSIIYGGINFRQCSKGHHTLYVIINTGQKIHG